MSIPAFLCADEQQTQEDNRIAITLSVSHWYGLSREQAILMCGIYKHEVAPKEQMITYAYFGIRRSDNPILAHCISDEMLFMVCAGLCAKTIKLHCPIVNNKTVKKFGRGFGKGKWFYKGYARDPDWHLYVLQKIKEYKNVLY